MNLVIVESPSKAKTIKKYLGKGYEVIASKGHVIDLPKSSLGVDPEKNFEVNYEVTKKDSLKAIKSLYKNADKLILAVDLDREGEAIGWHIANALGVIDENGTPKKKGKPYERIVFNEITKDAITKSIQHPREINMDLVNAQQARRVLDRLVGYKLSPLLWKKISFGLSAGRVQSAALKLIVEREELRRAFLSKEYWSVDAYLSEKKVKSTDIKKFLSDGEKEEKEFLKKLNSVKFSLVTKSEEYLLEKDADAIINKASNVNWVTDSIVSKDSAKNPKAPLVTSTLQQLGVNKLGFTSKRTMDIAQKLYEQGLITYMRTDSVVMSVDAVKAARSYINKKLGDRYLSKEIKVYKTSNKNSQEAHECIRPTDFKLDPKSAGLDGEFAKVYEIIWKRAISSQMASAVVENIQVDVRVQDSTFRANGQRVKFDGFLKFAVEEVIEKELPQYSKGQELYPEAIVGEQHFTQPPARYSEASLIKEMERLGIGRPSTYASIITTIKSRKYVDAVDGSKYLKPTDIGEIVNKLLVNYFSEIVDYQFTANMEDKLDVIAEGDLDWRKLMADFYFPFEKKLGEVDKQIDRSEFKILGKSDEACPICGKPMVVKIGKFGKFLSCSDFPKCKGMKSAAGEDGVENEIKLGEKYELSPKTEDGRDYELKKGSYGAFWAHPDYPKVKDAKPLLLKEKCPKCGSNLVERKGKRGRNFIGCSAYPKCDYIKKEKAEVSVAE